MRLILRAGRAQKLPILAFKRVRHAADRKHAGHGTGADQHPATRDARLIAHKPILSRLTAAPPTALSARFIRRNALRSLLVRQALQHLELVGDDLGLHMHEPARHLRDSAIETGLGHIEHGIA